MYTPLQKCKHLSRHFGFKTEELGEIKKMYSGEFFNPRDPAYLKLLEISEKLCLEFSNISGTLGKNPSLLKQIRVLLKKNKIIDLLFPGHGMMSGVGENVHAVIGLVDFNGRGFINRGVVFSPYTLTTCDDYSIFAAKINIGDNTVEKKGNLIKLGRIHFCHDCWICAGVNVKNGVSIGPQSVIGAGASVENDMNADSLILGRPAKAVIKIDKNYKSGKVLNLTKTPEQIKIIKRNLKNLGFKYGLKEYSKVLNGKNFNSTDINLGRIFILSHRLCYEYNSPDTSKKRKEEILGILFPVHGKNLTVGTDLFVDLLGASVLGDNVSIGNHVYMSGNVCIGDGATVKDGTLLYASGHSLIAKERHVGFSLKKGLYEYSQSGTIEICPDVTVGSDCVIVPGTVVTKDVSDGCIVTANKIIDHDGNIKNVLNLMSESALNLNSETDVNSVKTDLKSYSEEK